MQNEIAMRCSEACTRSGLAALVLSGVAFGLLPVIDEAVRINSLTQYLNLRLALAETINQVENDDCWKSLVSNSATATLSLEQIAHLDCVEISNQEGSVFRFAPKNGQDKTATLLTQDSVPPSILNLDSSTQHVVPDTTRLKQLPPPTAIAITMNHGMPQLASLTEIIGYLNNTSLLETARSVGTRFDHSIYRWSEFTRNTMLRRMRSGNVFNDSDDREHPEQEDKGGERNFWFTLNIDDLTAIARYELPPYEVSDEMQGRRQRVSIPAFPVPMDLRVGATILLAGLLLVAAYFLLYLQEARRNDTYPDRGTLFAVFYQQKYNHLLFIGLSLIPLISSILLTAKIFSSHFLISSLLQIFLVILLALVTLSVILNSGMPNPRMDDTSSAPPNDHGPTAGEG